jgi:transposase-like protein
MGTEREKAAIVAAYQTGYYTYRALSVKFGYSVGVIHKWVRQQGNKMSKPKQEKKNLSVQEPPPAMTEAMPSDVKTLQEELRKARLHSQLLSAMIDIAEEDLGVTIRKKYGAGRS